MLGDKPVFIQEVKKLEKPKNRINLPKNLNITPNEQIVFVNEDDYGFSIINYAKFIISLKKLEDKMNEALINGDINKYEKFKNRIDYICCNIFGDSSVSSNLRIIIPQIIISKYDIESEVYMQGSFNKLNIFKNEEKFKEYLKAKKRS